MAEIKYRRQSEGDIVRELARKARERLKALSPPDSTVWAPGESQPGTETVIARTRPKRRGRGGTA